MVPSNDDTYRQTNIIHADFQGHDIAFTEDGWFNATAAASRFGKNPHEWLRLPATKEYIEALERKYGKIPHLRTKRGRADGGTWLSPRLAVVFARWLDVDFAVWADEQIDSLIRAQGNASEYLPTYRAMHDKIDLLAAESSNKKFVHMNFNKLVNKTVGIGTGERQTLSMASRSRVVVAQDLALEAMNGCTDHHDGYAKAKSRLAAFHDLLAPPKAA